MLLIDGHSTHVKNLPALELARNNHIIILVLSPYRTHNLQPVDISFNKPSSSYFTSEHLNWMRKNKNQQVLKLKNLNEVFTPVYHKAALIDNAINSFKKLVYTL